MRVDVVSWAIYSGLQKEQLSVSGSECREDLSLRMACRGNGRGRPVGVVDVVGCLWLVRETFSGVDVAGALLGLADGLA